MENNNIKIIGVFATVLLLVIVITASFAYFGSFNVNLNNNVAVNVNSVSPGDATFTSNATQLNLQVPAANMSQTVANNTVAAENTAILTVNLTGATDLLTTCTYDIVYEYDDGSNIYGGSQTKSVAKNGDKEITLQVSGVNGTNNFASEKNFDYDSSWSELKRTLVSGATISSNGSLTTQNISITGKYYNLTISQSSLEGKAFTGKIYVTNYSCETSDGMPITTLMSTSTPDVYDENGMRYEGANPDNYICLDNQKSGSCSDSSLLFRIIGLFDEEYSNDGTNSAGTKKFLKVLDTNNYGGTTGVYWNSEKQTVSNNDKKYDVSFLNDIKKYDVQLTAGSICGGVRSFWTIASLKDELNENYITDVLSNSNINKLIVSSLFKTKWYLGGLWSGDTTSKNINDVYAIERDASAINEENSSYVYEKVGLIYLSDYIYANNGGNSITKDKCRNSSIDDNGDCINNWIFKSAVFVNNFEWLLMSMQNSPCSVYVFNNSNQVRSTDDITYLKYSARPTFYLDAEAINIVGGTGTSTDPYHID